MVKYYTASAAEGGWGIDTSYRDLMTGADRSRTNGATYTINPRGGAFVMFDRTDSFTFCVPLEGPQSVWTQDITGCAAVVYFYRNGANIVGIAMGHVNCGRFEHMGKGPITLARAALNVPYDRIDVVVAHGANAEYTDAHRYLIDDGVPTENILDYYDPLLKDFAANMHGWVGRVRFGGGAAAAAAVQGGGGQPHGRRRRCFLTTATCLALGLDDDCAELTDMRRFRDDVLARLPGGAEDIETYYRIAPPLVAAIDQRPDADGIYRALYSDWIAPVVADIRAGANDRARARYRAMVDMLLSRFQGTE